VNFFHTTINTSTAERTVRAMKTLNRTATGVNAHATLPAGGGSNGEGIPALATLNQHINIILIFKFILKGKIA